ncbi:MAG: lipid-A-disaccharide synthase [Syntrophales bacterium]
MVNSSKILILTGEASGDLYGAQIADAMREMDPTLAFYGVGGMHMRGSSVNLLADVSELGVVGLTEVLGKLGRIRTLFSGLRRFLKTDRPALVILIDYPGFNLRFARVAREAGIPVLYYISPKIWAWGAGRIRAIKETVNKMAVIFPFEVSLYEKAGVDVTYVGHPLLDIVRADGSVSEIRRRLGLAPDRRTIALLPGSRRGEVDRLLTPMIGAAAILSQRLPDLQFLLPLADTLSEDLLRNRLKEHPIPVHLVSRDTYSAVAASDAAIVASGTATLETALLGIPMVIVYKVSPLTYPLARLVIRIDHIGLPNIIAGRTIVPELIQGEASPERIAEEVLPLLTDSRRRTAMTDAFVEVRRKLGTGGAARNAARIACAMAQGEGASS